MKKTIVTLFALCSCAIASAQFYVSASGGYAIGTNKTVLGSEVSATGITDLKGSYGEGMHTQIRGGYFFTEKIGVELGVGYLFGFDQKVSRISGVPTAPEVAIDARGRAFGASLSAVYNFTKNLYVRAGYLTKIGGQTEVKGDVQSAALGLDLNFTTGFFGKFPSGVIGAVGYRFPMGDKWTLFTELEYMNISVTRNTSELEEFAATIAGTAVTRDQLLATLATLPADAQAQFTNLLPLLQDKVQWGENGLPAPDAPYSSFGINFGITYNF
ncbi:outer membrane beta-barrel protein [Tenacibaculum amylolyticum]|uniref:outer membrane beta-barrel protein n=1 Tax=Tenacibaculum amylolyticum TaxID=104269 RepID=UPI0038959B63